MLESGPERKLAVAALFMLGKPPLGTLETWRYGSLTGLQSTLLSISYPDCCLVRIAARNNKLQTR